MSYLFERHIDDEDEDADNQEACERRWAQNLRQGEHERESASDIEC